MTSKNSDAALLKRLEKLAVHNDPINPELYKTYDVKRGLRNANGTGVLVGLSKISDVSGYTIENEQKIPKEGNLYFRNIDIREVVKMANGGFGYEKTCFLLLFGHYPDEMEYTLATALGKIINDEQIDIDEGILHHNEGIDLLPSNIELSGLEVSLVNVMSREMILKEYISRLKNKYDYILIDCMPSLGMVTLNAFAAADSIIIPVQAAFLPAKGLEQLIKTIQKVKRQINPKLQIEGILMTMVDGRTNYAREIIKLLKDGYGKQVRFFNSSIPLSVRAAEISAVGTSIFMHDPNGKVAKAYQDLTKEVIGNE